MAFQGRQRNGGETWPTRHELNDIQEWARGAYSPDGSILIIPQGRRLALQVASATAVHSWKVFVRKIDGVWSYAVSDTAPNADLTWPVTAIAGSVINPSGSVTDVPVKDWTAITEACEIQILLSYAGDEPTPTIGTWLDATDLTANPALLRIVLAYISGDSTAGYRVTAEYQTSDIILAGAVIPPALAGYASGTEQLLIHAANGGVAWANGGGSCS